MDDFLFPFDEIKPTIDKSLLDMYAKQGYVFLSCPQVQKVLGKTYGQVRYAISNYALDAYIICGEYRITHQAVEDFINGVQEEAEEYYHGIIRSYELSGVYDLNHNGKLATVLKSINQHNYPITVLDGLLDKVKTYRYDVMDAGSTELEDFYDIPSLPIPELIRVDDLARMFQVKSNVLAYDLKRSESDLIEYSEVFDYLVLNEFLNASIPLQISSSQNIVKDCGQLNLF